MCAGTPVQRWFSYEQNSYHFCLFASCVVMWDWNLIPLVKIQLYGCMRLKTLYSMVTFLSHIKLMCSKKPNVSQSLVLVQVVLIFTWLEYSRCTVEEERNGKCQDSTHLFPLLAVTLVHWPTLCFRMKSVNVGVQSSKGSSNVSHGNCIDAPSSDVHTVS